MSTSKVFFFLPQSVSTQAEENYYTNQFPKTIMVIGKNDNWDPVCCAAELEHFLRQANAGPRVPSYKGSAGRYPSRCRAFAYPAWLPSRSLMMSFPYFTFPTLAFKCLQPVQIRYFNWRVRCRIIRHRP